MFNADYLIAKRKEKWQEHGSIEIDKQFREAVANELLTNKVLLDEVKDYPEKLVELVFIVVGLCVKLFALPSAMTERLRNPTSSQIA